MWPQLHTGSPHVPWALSNVPWALSNVPWALSNVLNGHPYFNFVAGAKISYIVLNLDEKYVTVDSKNRLPEDMTVALKNSKSRCGVERHVANMLHDVSKVC